MLYEVVLNYVQHYLKIAKDVPLDPELSSDRVPFNIFYPNSQMISHRYIFHIGDISWSISKITQVPDQLSFLPALWEHGQVQIEPRLGANLRETIIPTAYVKCS